MRLGWSSLASNGLCGIYYDRGWKGTYTAEAITKLCEALKSSAVTSIKCASSQLDYSHVKARCSTY